MDASSRERMQLHLRVSWFEIFYDLVIVAAVAHGSHLFTSDQGFDLGIWLVVTFVITFILWFSTSLAVNITPGDVVARKTLMFIQMIAVTMANLAVSRTGGLPDSLGFAALGLAFATVAVIYGLSCRASPVVRSALLPGIVGLSIGSVVLALGVFIPQELTVIGAIVLATGVVVAAAPIASGVMPRVCRDRHLHAEHLSERTGQFVIIVLGESFLALTLLLNGLDSLPGPASFLLAILVAGAMWAIYFMTIQQMGIPLSAGRLELWLAALTLFLIGICYSASLHAVYASQTWQALASSHVLVPLSACYVLSGALLLSVIGGRRRVGAVMWIHGIALGALLVTWAGFVVARWTPGNVLMVVSSVTVMADAVVSIAWHRRHRRADEILG